jgi:hypothetical protein
MFAEWASAAEVVFSDGPFQSASGCLGEGDRMNQRSFRHRLARCKLFAKNVTRGRLDARASLCALLAVSQHFARNVSARCVPVMASLFLPPDDDDCARQSPSIRPSASTSRTVEMAAIYGVAFFPSLQKISCGWRVGAGEQHSLSV